MESLMRRNMFKCPRTLRCREGFGAPFQGDGRAHVLQQGSVRPRSPAPRRVLGNLSNLLFVESKLIDCRKSSLRMGTNLGTGKLRFFVGIASSTLNLQTWNPIDWRGTAILCVRPDLADIFR